MTNRALTNIQSLNVFNSVSEGDSPAMEMATVQKDRQNKNTPSRSSLSLDGAEVFKTPNAGETLKDDVFSSPESCSMISSMASLTLDGRLMCGKGN